MSDHKEIERSRILTDLTGLAQNLITGGINKDQPDMLSIGKALLSAINSVTNQKPVKLVHDLTTESFTREYKDVKEEKEIKDLLSSLGITLN